MVLLLFTLFHSIALAESGKHTDEDGNPIVVPTSKTAYSLENPGARKKDASAHDPVIVSRLLVQGLETTRILTITVPHPLAPLKNKKAAFPIKAIYLVDKDGIVVGYHAFSIEDSEAVFIARINGVINYLEIYVECRQHGTWLKKVRFT